ncbi:hypothetical protein CAPTEDRAFT_219313 [Capitella teleta]|uniref:PDZ domain-containing protein n=1 Tax=Capitella teleta TaxID=283909 RepID=R7UH11_CAPTE|nr:hypothetical protein CAPTEDRAFT_219313 [Capitella teleta]|eukprot:ELU05829.1 hypothetical protein CAPTEDRAFT_219313 [Capitella teleta]
MSLGLVALAHAGDAFLNFKFTISFAHREIWWQIWEAKCYICRIHYLGRTFADAGSVLVPHLSWHMVTSALQIRHQQHGVMVAEYHGQKQPVRLQLTEDALFLQKQELAYTYSPTDHVDAAILARERIVHVKREKVGGLGLSVKGGAEHNLPILVSRIFKEQAADKTGQLFVGDAILKVNEDSIESFCHDEAVTSLKNAGDDVKLTVKYFHPASLFLSKNNKRNSAKVNGEKTDKEDDNIQVAANPAGEVNGNEHDSEKQWTDLVSIPLLCAFITGYKTGTDELRNHAFELISMDGVSSGSVQCADSQELTDWISAIRDNIIAQNNRSINLTNKTLLPAEHVIHMSWACERVAPKGGSEARGPPQWKRHFLTIKGADVCFFESAPVKTKDWVRCEYQYKIYECLLRVLKDTELRDRRQHCFLIETGQGTSHYLSVESRQELLQLEKAWYRATCQAVNHIGSETFGCTWRNQLSGLTLDLKSGFTLYDSCTKNHMWSYKFSQLRSSSDDGDSKLTLVFQGETGQTESREVECSNLQTLLYAMHAFLSAKLALVDPNFLFNL